MAELLSPNSDDPETWSISIYQGPTPVALSPAAGASNPVLAADDVTDLRAKFVADPFLVRDGQRWYLFFEIMPLGAKVGVIGLAESVDCVNWSYRHVVLREPFHLSYPHVFSWRGDYYMTPETLAPDQIRLYRAVQFPDRWEHIADLVPGRHADPSIFFADGAWWLFSCALPGKHETLRLYRSDSPTGIWREHPCSPVIEHDRRIARPAGRVVAWDGALLRFTQDCESIYGLQVRAFRITRLSATEYREEPAAPAAVVGPGVYSWNRRGMHHIDAQCWPRGGWIAAVDAR
jgi:hypothetical protein